MSDFFPALDQQRGEQVSDYIARLEKAQAATDPHQRDQRRNHAISDHLKVASSRLEGHSRERVKQSIMELPAEDYRQLLMWLATNTAPASE